MGNMGRILHCSKLYYVVSENCQIGLIAKDAKTLSTGPNANTCL